ncbi:thioredoxin domain-containing protein 17 [Bacillus rossius redtenbacheri]|uniref:thioredoxin domain-containing protein 17 n=1 Tax=Bacillus rossius redtenbacheri TaxID=93214 RepID=UPI002FDC9E21
MFLFELPFFPRKSISHEPRKKKIQTGFRPFSEHAAQPVIEKILSSNMNADFHFIEVDVGDKATWRDGNNPFRKDERIALTCVPTLLHWGRPQRLGDKDSSDPAKVEAVLSCS